MTETARAVPEHGFVVINALRLHYLDFGGRGKPLLLLHGVTSSSSVWHDLAPRIDNRRVIALDSRGHGDSQWSADHRYTTEDLASDVVDFVDAMGLDATDIAGASWGGLVGLQVAVQNPGIVASLTMIDIPPSFPDPPMEVQSGPASFTSHSEAIAYLRESDRYLSQGSAAALASFDLRPGKNGRLFWKHDDYFRDNRPHREVDYRDDLTDLQVPLLVVRAQNSTHLSNRVARGMLEVATNARLATLSHTGHRVSADNPIALGETMVSFLEDAEEHQ